MPLYLGLALALLVLGWVLYRRLQKKQARAALLATPLSEADRAIVADHVPLTRKLPAELRSTFEGKVNLFLGQVQFHGCNGLEVTRDMRLAIAAQACLLVANSPAWYSHLTTILVYPGAFKSRQQMHDGYVVTEGEVVRTGESWSRGPVILSWRHSDQGARDDSDGHNVVIHEFAHQLDDLSGQTDGAPALGDQSFTDWARVFVEAYERHRANVEAGRRTLIDPYGAEGHEEFFAVSVEAFFETPDKLKHAEPQVYDQLATYFRLDPATWPAPAPRA
ncbi:zinc-dependent peptidase [Roseovarius sp. MMSF_3281]|uniref:M90 family metallopeptidase n=1 Tax=Roseovarius sp. MMSF_3281 TaxID=3046694 RepID=UPI00273F820D|nr:M90 family metallopeptidase [Roseovarius sp. MMSF_3281]